MRISVDDLYFHHPDVGNGPITFYDVSNNPIIHNDGRGILSMLDEPSSSLIGRRLKDTCDKIKSVLNAPDSPYFVKQIAKFMAMGKKGIYELDSIEDPLTLQEMSGQYTVLKGNKRVIALILLGETEIEFSEVQKVE